MIEITDEMVDAGIGAWMSDGVVFSSDPTVSVRAVIAAVAPLIEAQAREAALREAADLAGDHATFYRELGQRAQEVGALGVRVAMRSLIDAPQQSPSQVSQTDEQAAKPSQPVDDVW